MWTNTRISFILTINRIHCLLDTPKYTNIVQNIFKIRFVYVLASFSIDSIAAKLRNESIPTIFLLACLHNSRFWNLNISGFPSSKRKWCRLYMLLSRVHSTLFRSLWVLRHHTTLIQRDGHRGAITIKVIPGKKSYQFLNFSILGSPPFPLTKCEVWIICDWISLPNFSLDGALNAQIQSSIRNALKVILDILLGFTFAWFFSTREWRTVSMRNATSFPAYVNDSQLFFERTETR